MNGHPSPKDDFKAWNEAMALKYNPDDYHKRSPLLVRWIERRRVDLIVGMLKLQSRHKVLELGCGAGNLLERLQTGTLFGLDLSTALLGIAASKKYSATVSLVRGMGESLPCRDGTFDRILCSEVLEHVPDPDSVCAEIHRALADDGLFVVSVPNEDLINSLKRVLNATGVLRLVNRFSGYKISEDMTDEWHLHAFGVGKLRRLLEPRFDIGGLAYAPSRLLPLRLVAWCAKK